MSGDSSVIEGNFAIQQDGHLDPGPIARRTSFPAFKKAGPAKQSGPADEQSDLPHKKPRETKPNPLTREQLDGRFAAAKLWDSLSRNIIAEAGGESEVSTIKRTLIEAYCGMAVRFQDLNIRNLLGQSVSLTELSLAASTMTRLASRIGIERVAREVENLQTVIQKDLERQQQEADRVNEVTDVDQSNTEPARNLDEPPFDLDEALDE